MNITLSIPQSRDAQGFTFAISYVVIIIDITTSKGSQKIDAMTVIIATYLNQLD